MIKPMNNNQLSQFNNLQDSLFNALNEHGYLFQEGCKYDLENNNTGWAVSAMEYPVSFNGQDTKIDLVLYLNRSPEKYSLVECKRADPAYTHWLFRVPNLNLTYSPHCSVLWMKCDQVSSNAPMDPFIGISSLEVDVPTYYAQSWLEVKAVKSQGRTSTPQSIENAFSQVLRGINGFAQEQKVQRIRQHSAFNTYIIPVVVTTALLHLAHFDPKEIDITTGKITRDKVKFNDAGASPTELPWILVNYGAAENIAPAPIPSNFIGTDPKYLLVNKLWSIFVVNSNHIVDFYKKLGSY
jgi:hypothetical protein